MVAIMVGRGGAGSDGRGRQVKQRSGANTLRVVNWHCVKVLEFQFGTHQEFWEFHFGYLGCPVLGMYRMDSGGLCSSF